MAPIDVIIMHHHQYIDVTTYLQVYLHTNCIAVLYNVCAACRFASASYVTCDVCPATNRVVMLSRLTL